ncbi:Kinase-like protein [Mycena sanguinolenta]|uniref:Kinase-like protein n=1 Tax=Mycena sanguinolenta TaxID=230812 RepID=A0A8H6Z984_9AGAR|nr:Kinase-like protein [Mycena sanguinolenta]
MPMNEDAAMRIPRILMYEGSFSFLKDACSTQFSRNPRVNELQMTVDDYILSMTFDNTVRAIVESLECRKRVFQLSTTLELTNDAKLRTAIRVDEEQIATLLVSVLSSKPDEEVILRLEGDSAQNFIDVVQESLDRGFIMAQEHTRMALRIVRKLSESCDRLPSSLFIVGIEGRDEHPTFGGGFGDIYRASYGGQRVALKRMRHFLRGSDLRRTRLKFCREALLWKDLHHPHILPFLGIDADSFPSFLCMVSPWMENGTVMNYLKTHGYASVDKLLYEIAQGLEYLHSRDIVHGDLRGANILVKDDWSACLSDFGLSIFSDATSTTSTNRGGSLYWMAPELLFPERFGLKFTRTPATDVYAFGCVCFELYTGRPPFSDLFEPAACMKVLDGERAERPSGPPAMSDTLWQNVTEFWAQASAMRPSTGFVLQNMIWPTPDPRLPPALPDTPSAPSTPTGNLPSTSPVINESSSSLATSATEEAMIPLDGAFTRFANLSDFKIDGEVLPVRLSAEPEQTPLVNQGDELFIGPSEDTPQENSWLGNRISFTDSAPHQYPLSTKPDSGYDHLRTSLVDCDSDGDEQSIHQVSSLDDASSLVENASLLVHVSSSVKGKLSSVLSPSSIPVTSRAIVADSLFSHVSRSPSTRRRVNVSSLLGEIGMDDSDGRYFTLGSSWGMETSPSQKRKWWQPKALSALKDFLPSKNSRHVPAFVKGQSKKQAGRNLVEA